MGGSIRERRSSNRGQRAQRPSSERPVVGFDLESLRANGIGVLTLAGNLARHRCGQEGHVRDRPVELVPEPGDACRQAPPRNKNAAVHTSQPLWIELRIRPCKDVPDREVAVQLIQRRRAVRAVDRRMYGRST